MALIASTYTAGANMGDPNLGNIFGDGWRWVKKNPLAVVAPPLYLAEKSFEYAAPIVKGAVQQGRQGAQDAAAAFRPPAPVVDPLTSALTLGSAGSSSTGSSSSMLPIVLGAGVAGVLLLLAFGRKRRKT